MLGPGIGFFLNKMTKRLGVLGREDVFEGKGLPAAVL